jgi:hypothetical protein
MAWPLVASYAWRRTIRKKLFRGIEASLGGLAWNILVLIQDHGVTLPEGMPGYLQGGSHYEAKK